MRAQNKLSALVNIPHSKRIHNPTLRNEMAFQEISTYPKTG
jgi:hypothetical protein